MNVQEIGLVKISQIIHDYCGLCYSDRLSTLKEKISKRVAMLEISYLEYYEYLQQSPTEWDILVELVTINETYFYREENQLNECCSVILPLLKKGNRKLPLRIWSAACSTGEEPYTLAMLIQETKLFPPGTVEIIATDINKKVLQKAEKGWYRNGSFSFRRIPGQLLETYFSLENGGYQINDSIRNMVSFQHLNLLNENDLALLDQVDIVFCRNVLIYFDQGTTKRVIRYLHQKLAPNGHLFLGHAESITDAALGFHKVDGDKTFYYRKETNEHETIQCIGR